MKKKLLFLIPIAIVACISLFTYIPLLQTFYQQDEWLGYGISQANGWKHIFFNVNGLIGSVLGQGRILTAVIFHFFYNFFPLNATPIAIYSILLHTINSILVFFILKKIIKNKLSALLGALFFTLNSVSSSSVLWVGAAVGDLSSTFLILISLIYFFKYIEEKNKKWLLINLILLYLSLFFKETGIFLFLFIPFSSLLFRKVSILNFIKTYWYFFTMLLLIVGYRLNVFRSMSHQEALFLTGTTQNFIDILITRSIFYPLTSFSLTLIPSIPFLNLSRYLLNILYPFIQSEQFILIAQTIGIDLLSAIFSILLFIFVYRKSKESPIIKFFLFFIISSFLPYVIISKTYSYFDSRYYYIATIGWAVILGYLLNQLKSKIVYVIFILFLLTHFLFVRLAINFQIKADQLRIKIVDQIKNIQPTLDIDKNIFIITSNEDYYVLGNKIPLQQGTGYTLMTLYYDSGKIPQNFLNNAYLFEIGSQGYREEGGMGFGFFWDEKELQNALDINSISQNSIIRLRYDPINYITKHEE